MNGKTVCVLALSGALFACAKAERQLTLTYFQIPG
jgi:hypothetical protein